MSAQHDIPIDSYVGQPREWLLALEKTILAQISGNGGGVITSENDGGLSLTYKQPGTPQQNLRAVRYALNGRTAESLAESEVSSSCSDSASPFIPQRFF